MPRAVRPSRKMTACHRRALRRRTRSFAPAGAVSRSWLTRPRAEQYARCVDARAISDCAAAQQNRSRSSAGDRRSRKSAINRRADLGGEWRCRDDGRGRALLLTARRAQISAATSARNLSAPATGQARSVTEIERQQVTETCRPTRSAILDANRRSAATIIPFAERRRPCRLRVDNRQARDSGLRQEVAPQRRDATIIRPRR